MDEENCLHCLWHGWVFNAFDGKSPYGDQVDTFKVVQRETGIFVGADEDEAVRRNLTLWSKP